MSVYYPQQPLWQPGQYHPGPDRFVSPWQRYRNPRWFLLAGVALIFVALTSGFVMSKAISEYSLLRSLNAKISVSDIKDTKPPTVVVLDASKDYSIAGQALISSQLLITDPSGDVISFQALEYPATIGESLPVHFKFTTNEAGEYSFAAYVSDSGFLVSYKVVNDYVTLNRLESIIIGFGFGIFFAFVSAVPSLIIGLLRHFHNKKFGLSKQSAAFLPNHPPIY